MERSRKLVLTDWTKANDALNLYFEGNKSKLTAHVQMSRTTVTAFFKPESVREAEFRKLCLALRLNWQEVSTVQTTPGSSLANAPQPDDEIAPLQKIREHCRQKILSLHSRMRLLSGEEIGVDQLYVDVWLLNRSPRTYQVSEDKLLKTFDLRNDRLGLGDRIKRNPGFEIANASAKLLILGKPGSGKTTFLKHLAVDWCKGKFQLDLIAVFIEFRRVRDEGWKLLDAICQELGLKDPKQIEPLLQEGKLLVLMDGLDEVPTNELRRNVQEQLRRIAEKYVNNRWIVTCRTQIIESIPVGFTSVEVADFNSEQVQQFVQNWFQASGQSDAEVLQQWKRLDNTVSQNPAVKELTVTPVLLSLMCLVFHDEGDMPSQVTDLYKRGIRLLLETWNDAKAIVGWEVGSETYRQLSVAQKEALLIEIAARKFENPENFVLFQQGEIVAHIDGFLRHASFTRRVARFLHLNDSRESLMVLKAMESQHGLLIERADELWSFSHLTFQEHFTVQWLTQLPPDQLAKKIADSHWQQVVEQLVKSQQPADRLLHLIKRSIDRLILGEPTLHQFLTWVLQKVDSIRANYKPAALRSFYFAIGINLAFDLALDLAPILARNHANDHPNDHNLIGNIKDILNNYYSPKVHPISKHDLDRGRALDRDLDRDLDLDLDLDLNRTLTLASELSIVIANSRIQPAGSNWKVIRTRVRIATSYTFRARELARDIDHALNCARKFTRDPELTVELEQLRAALPSPNGEWLLFEQWAEKTKQWREQLRQAMIKHRNIGYNWQFNKQQKQQLQHYHDANRFLVNLMQVEGAVSEEVRAEIEDSLLLPWDELQRRYPEIYGNS